jgi:hypothetical protein
MSTAAATKEIKAKRPHRWSVGVLLAVACVTGFIAIFSTWVKRQVLDTNNWTNTSAKVLQNKKVQVALGAYLTDQLFSNVDVAAQLRGALPGRTQALAGPAASGLRDLAERSVPQLLARPRVQDAWRLANQAAHKQLIDILNGGGAVASTNGGVVTLDLRQLLTQLASTVGISLPAGATNQLPANAGQLVILRSSQLKTAQNITKAIRDLSIIMSILTLVLFAAAIALASGWRRRALRSTGWCFAGVAIFVLLIRRVAGDWIVSNLVKSDSVRPAAHDVWIISTSLLRAIAIAILIYGLLIVLSAWLAGPTRPATAVRRALTPALRDRPVLIYGVAGFVYLLVLLWGPTPAFRKIIPIVLIGALIVLGIELLRRQAAREFPDARAGDTMQSLRHAWATRKEPSPKPVAGADDHGAQLDRLERLAALHDRGALTDAEYAAQKTTLLKPAGG